jgi:hypothetical protein
VVGHKRAGVSEVPLQCADSGGLCENITGGVSATVAGQQTRAGVLDDLGVRAGMGSETTP